MAEIVSGSSVGNGNWPTPTCADAYLDRLKSSQQAPGSMHSVNLCQAVNMMWDIPRESAVNEATALAWPTPLASDGAKGGPNQRGGRGDLRLSSAVVASAVKDECMELARPTPCTSGRGGTQTPGSHLSLEKAVAGWKKDGSVEQEVSAWPTPTASSSTGSGIRGDGGVNLQTAVKADPELPWATPAARDFKDSPGMAKSGVNPDGTIRNREDQLARQVPGQLNPSWVEALMCWPIGWTSADHMDVMNWPWAFHGRFVAGRGRDQHEWEPRRTGKGIQNRAKRIKAVGNGQDPSALVLAVVTLVMMTEGQQRKAA